VNEATSRSHSGHCPRCGAAARLLGEHPGSHRRCDSCGHTDWRNPLPVAGTLVVHEGRVLLTRRHADAGRGAGLWVYPGGFVEAGETAEEAALRETLEEVGLEARLTGLVGAPYAERDPSTFIVAYRAEAEGEPRPGPEVAEARWFAPDEIPWNELAFETTDAALRDLVTRGLEEPPHPLRPRHPFASATPRPPEPHCRSCGAALTSLATRERFPVCVACGTKQHRNPVTGVAAWVVRGGRVLMTRRAPGKSRGGGKWDGPAGHIEPGETPEEALLREAREEASIDLRVTALNGVFSLRDPSVVFASYACTTDDEPALSEEVTEIAWFAPHEIPWPEVFVDARDPLRELLLNGFVR